MTRGAIHHVDLTVSDVERSFPIYDGVLTALGYEIRERTEAFAEWTHRDHQCVSICILTARGPGAARRHDRYSPGLHHLALAVENRAAVDALFTLVQRAGAQILDAPADYPQYNRGKGYYAFFFADPDGLKLEIVWTPPAAP